MAQLKSTNIAGDLSVSGNLSAFGDLSASTIIKLGGTASQVLAADGSVINAVTSNTKNTIILRDDNGNFNAGTMYGTASYANMLSRQTNLTTAAQLDAFVTAGVIKWTGAAKECVTMNNDGSVLSFGYGGGYGSQIWMDDGSGEGGMYIRNVKTIASGAPSTWHPWRKVLTDGNFASVLDDAYLKDTTDTMYGTLTIASKNKNNQATTNNLIINGNNGAGGWIVRRSESDAESVKLTVNDSQAIFEYNNDERSNQFRFVLQNNDTESPAASGALPNTSIVTFDGSASGSLVSATSFSASGSGTFPTAYSRDYVLRDTGNVEIGSFNLQTLGTTSGTGEAYLIAGNAKASKTANNARGRIFLYNASTNYVQILPGTDSTYAMTLYLPGPTGNANETAQFVFHTNDTQIGSSTQPVYISATGKATAVGTIAVNNGGTGASSLIANSLMFSNSGGTSTMTGYHYADSGKVGIANGTTKPSYTLYVGTSKDASGTAAAGTLGVATSVTIAGEVTMQYDSGLKAMKFVF